MDPDGDKLTYISGVRAAELCVVRMGDVHWENGQWGRFLVHGKGANGSGPREREAFLFQGSSRSVAVACSRRPPGGPPGVARKPPISS